MAKLECLNCGKGNIKCFCARGGGNVHFDEFVLICPDCDERASQKIKLTDDNSAPACPYCKKGCFEHDRPPEPHDPAKSNYCVLFQLSNDSYGGVNGHLQFENFQASTDDEAHRIFNLILQQKKAKGFSPINTRLARIIQQSKS